MNRRSRSALKSQSGSIILMNEGVLIPLWLYRKRFCGLPNGVSSEPRIAAMFSKVSTGIKYFSLSPALKIIIVSGTKIISETSFVTNIDERKTEKTRKQEIEKIELSLLVCLKTGLKISSLLKPSRTVKSIKSVARVFQSMSRRIAFDGGVIKNDTITTASETESMISFFRRPANFLKNVFIG